MNEGMVVCPHCGAGHRAGATMCESCWRSVDAPARRVRTAPPPPPPPPGVPVFAANPVPAYAGMPAGVTGDLIIQKAKRSPEIRWRWPHLWLFGFFAWGIPSVFWGVLQPRGSFSRYVQASLFFQIIGYLIALGIVYFFVSRRHHGDWSTIGISFSDLSYIDLLRGSLFGLALLAVWTPIGLLLAGGLDFDPLVQMLVGGTSGIGIPLAILVVVVGAPLVEEVYYRGMLYEKLNRRNRWLAIVVTSILFVSAHGALLIPPLILMAVGLAWKRQKEGLWFTIGAHVAWNLVVMILAAVVLLGPAKSFTPDDGAYTLRHSADWQHVSEFEAVSAYGITIDLALLGPNGSLMEVIRMRPSGMIGAKPDRMVRETLMQIQQVHSPLVTVTESTPVPLGSGPGDAQAWQIVNQITDPMGETGTSHKVGLIPAGWDQVLIFELVCPAASCAEAEPDFKQLMESFILSTSAI